MLRLNLAGLRMLVVVCLAIGSEAQPLNAALQTAVTRAMNGQHGAAVVLDVRSGQVIASSHLDVAARRVVAPGSAIKPFTLMALLQSGKVNGQTALRCKRAVVVGGHKLDCSHPAMVEPLDPATALAYSCNSYFTTVALRLTPAQLQGAFAADGFSSRTTLAPNEAAGHISLAQSPAQLQLQAIGEWGVRLTPLELARAYRNLALLQSQQDASLAPLYEGLLQSVSYGMGNAAQPPTAMKVAGKTGTAPADEGAWTHAWFGGYSPAQNPEIALVILIEKGHGGSEAAPIARQIFAAYAEWRQHPVQQATGAQR